MVFSSQKIFQADRVVLCPAFMGRVTSLAVSCLFMPLISAGFSVQLCPTSIDLSGSNAAHPISSCTFDKSVVVLFQLNVRNWN
jgi:P pilus assembly chaperone PapD